MITMTVNSKDGRRLIVLGLDRENVNTLTKGKPLFMSSTKDDAVPVGVEVVVCFGETKEDVLAELERVGLITTNTKIKIERPKQ
jgi:hypothetical protein